MNKDKIYNPPDYYKAIKLALNLDKELIHIWIYDIEKDIWDVCVQDGKWNVDFQLQGKFVRSCFKAVRKGINRWNT